MLLETILLVVTLIYFTMKKLNLREVKYLVQGHPAGEWKSWYSDPSLFKNYQCPEEKEIAR